MTGFEKQGDIQNLRVFKQNLRFSVEIRLSAAAAESAHTFRHLFHREPMSFR